MTAKKRLLVILGAGSSIDKGMPSVSEIDTLMARCAREFAETRTSTNFYDQVWRALEKHLAAGFQSDRQSPNFERALGDLLALMHWVRPSPEGSALATVLKQKQPPPNLSFAEPDRYGPYIEVKTTIGYLHKCLAAEMRQRCREMPTNHPALGQWREMLQALRARFDVVIYNLNYDTVALSAWPEAFTGFNDKGRFQPAAVHRRDWEGIFHLHGSVHFSLAGASSDHIVWRDNLSTDFIVSDDRVADYASDGRDFLPTTLITGGFKLDQILTEPFQTYRAALNRDATLADAILIGGYGFGDAHVNRALRGALAFSSTRPPVLVLDTANDKTLPMDNRQDSWARGLRNALHTTSPYVGEGMSVPERPATLLKAGRCEFAKAHPVAIWYGGFSGAVSAIDRLGGWLQRAGENSA